MNVDLLYRDALLNDLRAQGLCRPCAALRDPAWGEYCDAINGAEQVPDGQSYTPEMRRRHEASIAAYEWAGDAADRDAVTAPNGCRWCGVEQHLHCNMWAPTVGAHLWVAPDDALRLMRMRARRWKAQGRIHLAVAARYATTKRETAP